MLLSDQRLHNIAVMSLQTGTELARTERPIIDPRNLTIVAFELTGDNLDVQPSLLRIEDIREYGSLGFIVDSSDEFLAVSDVIKLEQIYEFDFRLNGLLVTDTDNHKLGRVVGFSVENEGFVIQQISVKRPLLRSLNETEVLVHRKQIVSVSDEKIVVKSSKHESAEPIREQIRGYSNPFRQASPNR